MVVASGSMRIEMQNLSKGPKCRYEVKVTINGGETWGGTGVRYRVDEEGVRGVCGFALSASSPI